MIDDEVKQNLKEKQTWLRGLYMLLFAVFYSIAEVVIVVVILFQFLLKLFTGKTNQRLLTLGQSLSTYLYQVMLFQTFNSSDYPYPFSAWPKGAPKARKAVKKIKQENTDEDKEETDSKT